jgi:hypothetical protein
VVAFPTLDIRDCCLATPPPCYAPNSEQAMTQHIAPSDHRLNDQLCTAPPIYLSTVIICCLVSTLLYPGNVCVLVCVGAIDDRGTSADIISKVRHVGAVMTYKLQFPHETTEDSVPFTSIDPEMFQEGLIFP